MKIIKILAGVAIIVLIFAQTAGIIHFYNKSKGFKQDITALKPAYEKLSTEEKDLKAKYADLLKENAAMKEDRNNLLTQAKNLLGEKNRASELEISLGKTTKDLEVLTKEKQEIDSYNLSLKDEVAKLQEAQTKMAAERDDFKIAYEKARKDTTIKELQNGIFSLQKEKNNSMASLLKMQKDIDRLGKEKSELTSENDLLAKKLNDYKRNYDSAEKKNKGLEDEAKRIPAKFAEIGRQNKRLIRETAEMHYNLGVFYTKGKEYERATAEFEKVIEITPDDSYAHFNLGYIYAEYLVNRKKAIEHFRHFLRLAKSDDKDVDWVRKYLLTWETYEGKKPMQ